MNEEKVSKPKSRKIEKKFMNCVEFALMLGSSSKTVQKLCEERKIPHLRLGDRSILIDPEKAIAALEVKAAE